MVATRKHLIWAILASAVLAAPVGYLLGQGLVGSASSAGLSGTAAAEDSADGRTEPAEISAAFGAMQDPEEIAAALEATRDPDEFAAALEGIQDPEEIAAALEATNPGALIRDSRGVNLVPDVKPPEALVEGCKSHLRRGVQSPEQADQVFACKALLLADEGKIAPGQYTNDEMESLVESQEPNVELQR